MLAEKGTWRKAVHWFIQWLNNVFKDLGTFHLSALLSQFATLLSPYLWPCSTIASPTGLQACSPTLKAGREHGGRNKRALLVSIEMITISLFTHWWQGSQGKWECSKRQNHLDGHEWLGPTMIHLLERGTWLPPK